MTTKDKLVEQAIERMINEGIYSPPDPYQDLAMLIQMTQLVYLQARVAGVPEAQLQLMRRYMDQAKEMLILVSTQEDRQQPFSITEKQHQFPLLPFPPVE